METGIELIAAERKRQVEAEGYSQEHDDSYQYNELACAASWYAMPSVTRDALEVSDMDFWPWRKQFFKPGDRLRELVKAGALIAAEIDRMQRSAV